MVRTIKDIDPAILAIAIQMQEKINGKGYLHSGIDLQSTLFTLEDSMMNVRGACEDKQSGGLSMFESVAEEASRLCIDLMRIVQFSGELDVNRARVLVRESENF